MQNEKKAKVTIDARVFCEEDLAPASVLMLRLVLPSLNALLLVVRSSKNVTLPADILAYFAMAKTDIPTCTGKTNYLNLCKIITFKLL